jgi:hypothetical protein
MIMAYYPVKLKKIGWILSAAAGLSLAVCVGAAARARQEQEQGQQEQQGERQQQQQGQQDGQQDQGPEPAIRHRMRRGRRIRMTGGEVRARAGPGGAVGCCRAGSSAEPWRAEVPETLMVPAARFCW